jgi:hypothetical protein
MCDVIDEGLPHSFNITLWNDSKYKRNCLVGLLYRLVGL